MALTTEFACICTFLTLTFIVLVDAGCHPLYGPTVSSGKGVLECKLLEPYYNKYQWASCVSNAYLDTVSKGSHYCLNSRPFCWYQCMIEAHNISNGPVYNDCACGQDAVVPTGSPSSSTAPSLPQWCYSPDGTNCDWYTECLEKRHPCSSDKNGYALEFALEICNLYSRRRNSFSYQGQRWIDAVRKCLQVELVPIIRPYVQTNCNEIKERAFATHSPCYLAPYPGEPSICVIPLRDWGQVFWTIKGAFAKEIFETLDGMLDVTRGCSKSALVDAFDASKDFAKEYGMRLLKLTWKKIKSVAGKRSIAKGPNELANSVAEQLAEQLEWEQKDIQWFPYISDSTQEHDAISVNILLGSRSMYDVYANDAKDVDMNKSVDELAEAIGNGKLHLSFGNDLNLTHFSACLDLDCQEKYHDITPKLSTVTSNAINVKVTPKLSTVTSNAINVKVTLKPSTVTSNAINVKAHGVSFLILSSFFIIQFAKKLLP